MKYINAFFEGSLLKYTLDEPLIEGNIGIYHFKLDISNFSEARNSEWKRLYEANCLCAISFKNEKNQESTSDFLIVKNFEVDEGDEIIEKTFLTATVPGNQLIGRGRLQFGIRFFISDNTEILDTTTLDEILKTEIDSPTSYGTIELVNPPMVYPSNQFTTTIDITDDTRLSTLLSTLSGGSEDSILVKKTDGDYDVTWVTSLPGALVYGGSGSFDSNGQLNITLTPKAQELLVQSGAITVGQTEVVLNPNTPELYNCLEFVIMADATTMNDTHNFGSIENVIAGDKLISDGVSWKRVSAAQVAIDGTNLSVGTIKVGTKTLPNYRVAIGGQSRNINLLSLGDLNTSLDDNVTNGLLSSTRNILNFAGAISDFTTEGNDTEDHWYNIGNCSFYVSQHDSNLISFPQKTDGTSITGDSFVKNYVFIYNDKKLVIQEWHGISGGRCFYRTSADWQNWYEYYNSNLGEENSVIPIKKGGTGANNTGEARNNLAVYSKTETDSKLGKKADLLAATIQKFNGTIDTPQLKITPQQGNPAILFNNNNGIEKASISRSLTATNGYMQFRMYPEDTNNRNAYFYSLPAPANSLTQNEYHSIYSTKTIQYHTSLPTFNAALYPKGTICLVKVSE